MNRGDIMLECIWYGFAAAFIFIGITATVYMIMIRVFKNGADADYIVAIPVTADNDDIGSILYSAHMRLAVLGDVCSGRVIVVDMGMSESQRTLCQGIMKECGNMEICLPQEISDYFTSQERETDGSAT